MEFFRQWLISCWDDLDKQLKTDKFDERLLAEMHAISSAAVKNFKENDYINF